MNSQELLEKYGKAASVVKEYYLGKFLDSMESENLPENFKEFAKEQGIDNDTVAKMIEAMPRALFDVFDVNEIYINITAFRNGLFLYSIITDEKEEIGSKETSNTRKEAEKLAIEKAFEILNEKL
jgi:hypothetical protein